MVFIGVDVVGGASPALPEESDGSIDGAWGLNKSKVTFPWCLFLM
jgi:hypothetical protein